jgi:hypothetical protein
LIETNLFSITPPDDLEFFLDSSDGVVETTSLYFTRPSKLHYGSDDVLIGSIELVHGRIEDGLDWLLHESVVMEVDLLGGYVSDPFDEDLYSFSANSTLNGIDSNINYVLISTELGYCVQLKFLKGYTEDDILEICKMMTDGSFKGFIGKASFGDVLELEISESQLNSRVGSRIVFHSAS